MWIPSSVFSATQKLRVQFIAKGQTDIVLSTLSEIMMKVFAPAAPMVTVSLATLPTVNHSIPGVKYG
ncbi:unnamed protein product [Phytomonas sp. Hart1]|nr:unnamed protein product [Phytomonas sp. Hart1]|eukprot:CCW69963.1 unnamed protein product [Phytomonas sp. isolate Hart1]